MPLWRTYKNYVHSILLFPSNDQVRDVEYWQKRVFATGVLYSLPLGLLALISSLYLKSMSGTGSLLIFEEWALATFAFLVLAPKLPIGLRKALVVALVATVAIVLTILLGEPGILCIYLLSLSSFMALIYSSRLVYVLVAFNIAVLTSFALGIHYRILDIHLVLATDMQTWVIYSLNFILMNLTIVVLTRQFFRVWSAR